MRADSKQRIARYSDPELEVDGWVVVDSEQSGMAFGGCRFSLDVDENMVRELAYCMTLKLAGHGLPVGGAKGGLRVDPTRPDIMLVAQRFGAATRDLLQSTAVIGKDLGATNEILDNVYLGLGQDQLAIVKKRFPNCEARRIRDFTGYQSHMTGFGVAIAVDTALDSKTSGLDVLIQGYGAVGQGAAIRLAALGAKIIGFSDHLKAVYRRGGFNLNELQSCSVGGIIDIEKLGPQTEILPRDLLLSREADILVLAATSNCINTEIAESFQCDLVAEGANFPILPDASTALLRRKITVIPDVIANSASSALVGLQMASGNSISDTDLWDKIQSNIRRTTAQSKADAIKLGCDLKTAYQRGLRIPVS
jgi:glutamate dehydrogenase (NAD(P)+)